MREQVGGWTHLHVAHARPAIAGFGLATALPASHDGGRLEVGSGLRCGQGNGVPRCRREKGATGGASSKAWRRRGARWWLGEALPLGNGGQGRGARGSRAEEGEGVREGAPERARVLGFQYWRAQGRDREAGAWMHAAAKLSNGGHVHGQVPPVEAFHRARGGQRRGQGGTPFWAASRPN